MANGARPGNVLFLGSEFVFSDLLASFAKANTTYIEPNAEFHTLEFDAANLSDAWKAAHKQPVVTIHEGKYIFLYKPEDFKLEFEDQTDLVPPRLKLIKGFKSKFVTKYNFHRAKYVAPPPAVDTRAPIYEDRRYDDRFANRPVIRPNSNQNGGGYTNNNRRFDERS